MLNVRARATLIGLALLIGVSGTAWAQAPTLTANVVGHDVTLTWTEVPGAAGYFLEASAGGNAIGPVPLGNVTTFSIVGVPFGTYLVRVTPIIGGAAGTPSNLFTLVVAPSPPAGPNNFAAIINGASALLSWDLASATESVIMQVGSSSGAADIASVPLGPVESLSLPDIPQGNYFLRVFAAGATGVSVPSNELALTLPGCAADAPIPLSLSNFFGFVTISWPAVPGATGYQLLASSTLGGPPDLLQQSFGPTTTRLTASGVPLGNYYVTLKAQLSCGPVASSGDQLLKVDQTSGSGPRTPDPAPGTRLPLPNRSGVVSNMASLYASELRNSCREHGGNNAFLFRLVQRLRQEDSRWGLNWKRGNRGDMSQDIVTYHYGAGPDEDSTQVYIIDTISGHCGSRPGPNWADVTEATRQGNTIGRWTLQPFLNSGYTP
jgi:hypothetical protein